MHRYTTEFGYRYNNRENSGVEKFQIAVSQSAKNRLPYVTLIGKDKNPLFKLNPNDPSIPTGKDKEYGHLDDIDIESI